MKRITKYVVSLMIAIFLVLGVVWNLSEAVTFGSLEEIKSGANVSNSVRLYNMYNVITSRNDLYCVQYGATLRNYRYYTYNVQKYIEITGNTATDVSTGTTVNNKLNGTLAYILSRGQGYGPAKNDNSEQQQYTEGQQAVYAIINNWYNQVGSQFGINWSDARNNNFGRNALYTEAENYANNIGNSSNITQPIDNTNKDNIRIESYKYSDGISYIRIGPFNWTFSGTFDEIRLRGDGGQDLYINNSSKNNLWVSKYQGLNEIWINPNQITSGENFYLTIRADSGIRNIESIEARGKQNVSDVKTARLWFLSSANKQNLLLEDHGTSSLPQDISLTITDIPITKDLTVVKKVKDQNIYLKNVGFIFYNRDMGQYLVRNGNSYTYTSNRDEASEFVTDANGRIQLDNIMPGTYIAYETKNPNYGYAMIDGGIEIPLDSDIYTIENEDITRDLVIYKVSDEGEQIKLPGVKFIFYNQDTGEYIKQQIIDGNEISYSYTTNRDEALVFETDANGAINLPNIIRGRYLAYELENPNYGYAMIEGGIEIPSDVTEYNIVNDDITKDLVIYKVDEDNEQIRLEGVTFIFYNADTQEYIKEQIVNGDEVTYTYTPNRDEALVFETNANGEINLPNIIEGRYIAYELSNPNYGYEMIEGGIEIPSDVTEYNIVNDDITKDLVIYKVDEDNEQIRLEGVTFIFYNADTQEYIKEQIVNGDEVTYTYTPNRDEALVFETNANGEINLPNIIEGRYIAYELSNPNYGYEMIDEGIEIQADETECTITNRRIYIKLSGYVWEDIQSEKQSIRNDYYRNDENDDTDARMSGVQVRLMSKGQVVVDPETGEQQITTTNENGEYLFENVEIDNLSNYYVEFTYDGLTYQNVVPHLDADNGSKAIEPERQEFNNRFASVEAGSRETEAAIKDAQGTVQATVEYEITQQKYGRIATPVRNNNCDIIATTQAAGFVIEYERGSGVEEITNINLGVYKRRQADLALQNELDQVKVEIQGYGHIYKYGSGYNTQDPTEVQNSWNLGVRFESPYKQTYGRPIYQADAEYESEDDSKELKVSLTYALTVANQESLTSRVNRIVDYFDSRYTIAGIGTGINESDGSITGALEYEESEYNDRYKKVEIYANSLLRQSADGATAERVTQQTIYIQFNISRENVLNMLNEAKIYGNNLTELENADKNLKNIAEITSFTTYTDDNANNLYAAIDKDSIPGNVQNLEDETSFEDDTDRASTIALVIANAREISGTVFEDLTDEELARTQNIAQGNGIYDTASENAIGGVTVQLMEVDSNGNITDNVAKIFDEQVVNDDGTIGAWTDATAEVVTDTNGNYTISGFVPGKYVLKYTWGDGSYKIVNGTQGDNYESMVENYKSTVIDYDRAQSEANNNKFYRSASESDTRMSHAIDNIDERKAVDENLKVYNYQYEESKDPNTQMKMTSTTPVMEFNVEYDDNDLMSIDLNRIENRIAFSIKNMDFGIVRRPEQNINLVKSVSEVRLSLQNDQVLVNVQIDENGNLVGEANYTTYMPPIKENGITVENGYLRIELDQGLIQGSQLEMKYRLTAENASQADYVDESYGYYKYGESYYEKAVGQDRKDTDVVTVSPTRIIDYLDEGSTYLPDDATNIEYRWQELGLDQIKDENLVAQHVIDAIETGEYTTSDTDSSGNAIIDEVDLTQIYSTDYLANANLKPVYSKGSTLTTAESGDVYMVVSKVLSSSDQQAAQNQAEIIVTTKTGGGKFTSTPGNYIPNKQQQETDDFTSPEIIVIPSTGENRQYILPITIGVIAFVILGVGIILIKKFVIDKRK